MVRLDEENKSLNEAFRDGCVQQWMIKKIYVRLTRYLSAMCNDTYDNFSCYNPHPSMTDWL